MKTIKEYEKIKNNVYYFDWHILSYLSDINKLKSSELKKNVICLDHILFKILNQEIFVIPFSNAHFLDILTGSDNFIVKSLKLLEKVSQNWNISDDYIDNKKLRITKIENLNKNFNEYRTTIEEGEKIFEKINDGFLPLYEKIKELIYTQSKYEEMSEQQKMKADDLSNCLFPGNNEPLRIQLLKLNKSNKFQLRKDNGKIYKYPDYWDTKRKHKGKDINQIIDICIRNSDWPMNSLEEFTSSMKDLFHNEVLTDFQNNVSKMYFVAEMINVSSEKIESKTAFKGITNDIIHLSYGLRANCFVTEDNAMYLKAKFIAEYFNLNSKIFKIEEMIEELLKYITNDVLKNQKRDLFNHDPTYAFNDTKGNLIKEFSVSIGC